MHFLALNSFSIGEISQLACRLILGLTLLIFGINGFLKLLSQPAQEEELQGFILCLEDARFIMPSVKIIEIICGFFLIFGMFPLLSLVLLSPIIFIITGVQIILNLRFCKTVILLVTIPYFILFFNYWPRFSFLFAFR